MASKRRHIELIVTYPQYGIESAIKNNVFGRLFNDIVNTFDKKLSENNKLL